MGRKSPFSFLKDLFSSFLNPQTFCKTWYSASLQFIYVRKSFFKISTYNFFWPSFSQQKKHPFIDAFFGILFFWIHERRLRFTKITLRQEHLSILLIGRGNMLWISFENLEYWRVNYHPPKGRWLLGSHRLLFKKFGIWVSTWILRQPLFLQACPHRLYCIGS